VLDLATAAVMAFGGVVLLHPLTAMATPGLRDMASLGVPAATLAALLVGVNAGLVVGRAQTAGQWVVGVRVVDVTGAEAGLGALMSREGLTWLAVVLGPAGWLGLLGEVALLLSVGRTVRDRLTGTRVVRDS
jgi:uncharacterized RDD family membrane protein YckC